MLGDLLSSSLTELVSTLSCELKAPAIKSIFEQLNDRPAFRRQFGGELLETRMCLSLYDELEIKSSQAAERQAIEANVHSYRKGETPLREMLVKLS